MKVFKNIMDFLAVFSSEEVCHNFLKNSLWGVEREYKHCLFCGNKHVYEYKDYKRNRCGDCKETFSIRKNTLFEDSKISLQKWFMTIYLINSNKKGISSLSVSRQIGVTQKTAWFMLQRIRLVSDSTAFCGIFDGITEIDEAYLGGSDTNKHKKDKFKKEKTVVLGMVERNSKKVKAVQAESSKTHHLQPDIYKNVAEGSAAITDSYPGYDVLNWNYKHESVNHSAKEYVKTDSRVAFKIHTNTVEGFLGNFKERR